MRFAETFAMMVLVAGGASVATWLFTQQRIDAALAEFAESRPPIAVVDYSEVYAALKSGADLSELQVAFAQIGALGDRLASEGYLVLTSAQVVDAPESAKVAGPEVGAPAGPLSALPPVDLSTVVDGLAAGQGGSQ